MFLPGRRRNNHATLLATLIPYPDVLSDLTAKGLKSLYYNSGAFGFAQGVRTVSRGWIGPEDSSISPAGRAISCQALPPFEITLCMLFKKFWRESAPGPVWVMPRSHWAYELQFGNAAWLSDVLKQIGIDPTPMLLMNNGAALQFEMAEEKNLAFFVENLLKNLAGSDFQAVFANRTTICTIHSRSQLWWTTVDAVHFDRLDQLLPLNANANPAQVE